MPQRLRGPARSRLGARCREDLRLGEEPHEALREAGWNPEVEKVYGLGILGDALNPTRRKVRELSGQNMVPVLETDDGEVISGSDKIAKWARDNPAAASDRAS